MAAEAYDLTRFEQAQEGVFETALDELRAGRKRTHWMWFIFPQLRGLGRSPTAQFYGLASLDEARAYLAHPVLGPRLERCVEAMAGAQASSLRAIFGSPDELKFRSCMTLFATAAGGDGGVYRRALDRWCGGRMDPQTLALVAD